MMAAEGLSVQLAARVLNVSVSGYNGWKTRAPSACSIRHALLTDAISEVHVLSRGTYGVRRADPRPRFGRRPRNGGAADGRAGIKGVTGRPKQLYPRMTRGHFRRAEHGGAAVSDGWPPSDHVPSAP